MFVCIGLYFVFGRFFYDAFVRRRLHYAITDRRIELLASELRDAQLSPARSGRVRPIWPRTVAPSPGSCGRHTSSAARNL